MGYVALDVQEIHSREDPVHVCPHCQYLDLRQNRSCYSCIKYRGSGDEESRSEKNKDRHVARMRMCGRRSRVWVRESNKVFESGCSRENERARDRKGVCGHSPPCWTFILKKVEA